MYYAAPKRENYDYETKPTIYDYKTKGKTPDYGLETLFYSYAEKPTEYDYVSKITDYTPPHKSYPLIEPRYDTVYKPSYNNPTIYNPPIYRTTIYDTPFSPRTTPPKIKLPKHDYPTRGRKRRKQSIKAQKIFNRDIMSGQEALSLGISVSPFTKEYYKYGGKIDLEWDTEKGRSMKNTLKAPKLPKNRVIPFGSKLEKMIASETKKNRKRALSQKRKPSKRRTSSTKRKSPRGSKISSLF